MLKNSSNDNGDDDDVMESSIFDLDHAPAPRVSMFLSPHHNNHSNNNNNNAHSMLLQQDSLQQNHPSLNPMMTMGSDLMIPQQPTPPPPSTTSSRLRLSTSLSPRPPSTNAGRMSRKSIIMPMGEHHQQQQHVVSLPPAAAPPGGTNTFHRRRLNSYSSIPTVGGSYTYGPSSFNSVSNSMVSSSNASNTSLPYPATTHKPNSHHTTRQRSFSAAAVFSNASTTTSPTAGGIVPSSSHLAHVRSFPPPYGTSSSSFRAASISRNEMPSPTVPQHTASSYSSTTELSYRPDMYSPSLGSSVPIIRIEESKEPIDGDDTMDDLPDDTASPWTDSEYESDVFNNIQIKDTGDPTGMVQNDTGFSSGSEQPLSFLQVHPTTTTKPNDDVAYTPSVSSKDPATFVYPNHDLTETRNYDLDDSTSHSNNLHHNNDSTTSIHLAMCCGCIPLPRCFAKRRISWDRVASFFAVWSPCFLLFRMEYSTYRAVLFRLNILCGIMAIVQLTMSSFHFAALHSRTLVNRNLPTVTLIEVINENDNKFEVLTNVWNLNGSVLLLGIVALVVFVAVVSTVRAIQNVNLAGAIRYYWLILWVMPLQAFWAVSMFDYFHVTEVWIEFWWRDKTMAWYRQQFCDPSETFDTLCAVPIYANPVNETEWCQSNYNSTACTSIRDKAQEEVARYLSIFYSVNSAWTILFILLLFLVLKTLESIITTPLVEKSRQSSIPSWLILPMAGCFICGSLFSYSPSSILNLRYGSVTQLQWIAPIFMIAGGMFFVLALLAWLLWTCPITQTSHKHNKSIGIFVFILISFAMILTMATIFASCIVESWFLGGNISYPLRGEIACSIDQSGSCTLCPDDIAALNYTISTVPPEDQCPEWSLENVTRVLQSQAKTGANLAIICMFYAIGAFRYGLTVRKHILNYKIAYV